MLAAEAVSCLNKALCHLKDIWEEIGIPEDQRLQRTNVVKNHVKVRQIRASSRLQTCNHNDTSDGSNPVSICARLSLPVNRFRQRRRGILLKKTHTNAVNVGVCSFGLQILLNVIFTNLDLDAGFLS